MNSAWLALLNVGRNRRRTGLLLLIMVLGTAGLIVNSGLISYIFNGLRDVAIYGRFGHIQVYRQGYKLNHQQSPLECWFSEAEYANVNRRLEQFPHVKFVTAEATLPVYLTWGERRAAGLATGVAPSDVNLLANTRLLMGTDRILDSGSFADTLVGRGLAEKLQLRVGDILTVTALNSNQGYNGLDLRVSGIFEEGFRDYDDWTLKLPLSALQRLAGQAGVEKILLILDDTNQTDKVRADIQRTLKAEGLTVETASWLELAEFYRQVIAMFGKELNVIQWIVQALVFFAMVAALAMMFTERQHEMATLLSMGMTRSRLLLLFGQESAWMGVSAAVLGAVAGIVVGFVVSQVGISMPPPPGSTRGFIARVNLAPVDVLYYSFFTFVIACLAPAVLAFWIWRFNIAAALRQERN